MEIATSYESIGYNVINYLLNFNIVYNVLVGIGFERMKNFTTSMENYSLWKRDSAVKRKERICDFDENSDIRRYYGNFNHRDVAKTRFNARFKRITFKETGTMM